MSKEPDLTQNMFDYIARLEKTNNELGSTLQACLKLLAQFKSSVPSPREWQRMLDVFQKTIEESKKVMKK